MPNEQDQLSRTANSRLHVAIIMDGSGRWAVARGYCLARKVIEPVGAAVRRTIAAALTTGIRTLTLFTFSTENWGRPETEVSELMQTFENFFLVDAPAFVAKGTRISVVGRRDRLPNSLRKTIESVEATSAEEGRLHVRFAIDYSGREAILNAARRFQSAHSDSASSFSRLLAQSDSRDESSPDVDLLIRTGGELRLSNCPLWEIAYAELYFTECLWPDFDAADLDAALNDFHARDRRFGRVAVVT